MDTLAALMTNHAVGWVLIGTLCLAIEMTILSGIGCLFIGLAALTVGLAISYDLLPREGWWLQLGWACLLTVGWALLLWKPLHAWYHRGPNHRYDAMIGERAVVIQAPLSRGHVGVVQWSGTQMAAMLAEGTPHHIATLAVGSDVVIVNYHGNRLIVIPAVADSLENPPADQDAIAQTSPAPAHSTPLSRSGDNQ